MVKTHGTCVPSLVGELSSHILCSVAKKKGEGKKRNLKRRERRRRRKEGERVKEAVMKGRSKEEK